MTPDFLDFTSSMDGLRAGDDGFRAMLAPNWLQGRAGFGGLVAALGLAAIRRRLALDWPLRSLTVAFVGPAAGELDIRVQPLRQGRTAAFAQATILAGPEVAATVTACLGPDRPSTLDLAAPAAPTVPPPEDCPPLPLQEGVTPMFLTNLEIRPAAGRFFTAPGAADLLWWARHRDDAAWGTEPGLVSLLDTPPPAAAGLLPRLAPLSSLTWLVDLPSADLSTQDGWYLLRSTADHAAAGFSGEAMAAWARDGRPVALHRQSVAIFA